MGLFLRSHMAMGLPSADPDVPFPGKPWTHMGSLCLCVHHRRGKINTYTFPWKQVFIITQNMKTIFFSIYLLLPLGFIHLPSSRSRNNLVSEICESCQDRLSGLRHHNHLKGLSLCFVDLKLHQSGDRVIHPFTCWQDSNLMSIWRVTYSDNRQQTGLIFPVTSIFSDD